MRGVVERFSEREAAEEAVRNPIGVRDVVDEIRVAPAPSRANLETDVDAAIRRRFLGTGGPVPMRIATADGVVTLSGFVATFAMLEELERTIRSIRACTHRQPVARRANAAVWPRKPMPTMARVCRIIAPPRACAICATWWSGCGGRRERGQHRGADPWGAMGAVIGHEEAGDVNTTSGIAEGLVKQIGGMVQPGQSSLLVLADTSDPVRVAQRLGAYGGTILRTTLPADEVERLQRVIAEHETLTHPVAGRPRA